MQDLPLASPRPLDHLVLDGRPGDPALTASGATLNYEAVRERVATLAAALASRVSGAGARVASWLPKTETACLLPLAAARAGMVHVPINPVLKRAQVAHILSDSGARLFVTAASRASLLETDDVPVGCAVLLEADLDSTERLGPSEADPDAVAALIYTSGSTGAPKGVMLSHANLWLGAQSVRTFLRLDAETRTLCLLPLAFDYGQNQLLSTWAAGGHAIALDYLLPSQVVDAVKRHRANTLAGVPSLWADLVEARWSDDVRAALRCLTNSGGHLPLPVVRALRTLFPAADLHLMYGLTEAFRASTLDPALADRCPDSVGTAIPFAELLVLDAEGRECGAGVPGELVQAGPLVAQGYWRDPARTEERFRPAPPASRYGGKAVWSGDTVVRGADSLLRVLGRTDEQIKVAGHRVSPSEIEEAAEASETVREAVAVGRPHGRRGAAIHLFVRGDPAGGQALAEHLKRVLPGYMQPEMIVWLDRMPLGPNGKVDRAALRRETGG